jgi:cell wall-associated NlpC family hydrolase
VADPRLTNAALKAGKRVGQRTSVTTPARASIGEPPNAAAKSVKSTAKKPIPGAGGFSAKKPSATGGLSPKSLKAERDANKGASAKKKTGKVLKDTVKGATGSSAEGKLVGGGLQGAVVGLVKGILTTTKGRWFLALALVPLFPVLFWIMIMIGITGTVSTLASNNVAQTSAVSASTGLVQANMAALQSAAESSITPWELMAATLYYETGIGSSVGQIGGACPPGASPDSICPSVVMLNASSAGSSSPTGSSVAGSAPTPVASSSCVSSGTYVGVGIDCAVGRNGSVPTVIPPSSPDYTTTDTADWACIRQAESGDAYSSASAPSGAYGILESTWVADGFATLYNASQPYEATPVQQNEAALFILNNHPNSFYPGWDDACTLNAPGQGGTPTITAIAPGVEIPGSYSGGALKSAPGAPPSAIGTPQATSSGECPTGTNGPYCILSHALPSTEADSLTLATQWFGTRLYRFFYLRGAGDVSLLQGVNQSLSADTPPTFDPTNKGAIETRTAAIRALGNMPIANNSATLDRNIYLLAVDWAAGYSPQAGQSCATNSQNVTTLTATGPSGQVVLNSAQLQIAERIIRISRSHNSTSNTQIALIASALDGSLLGQSATTSTLGVLGDGIPSLPVDVSHFLKVDTIPNASPAMQSALTGTPAGVIQPWISAATLVVRSLTDTLPTCNYGSSIPNIAGGSPQAQAAMTAAKTMVGVPYVYGGGGSLGTGMGLSGLGAPACSGGFVVSTAIYGAGNPCSAQYATQTGLPGLDCSGLIQYAFAQANVSLPRTSQEQYLYVQARSAISTDLTTMQPGDLLFYFPDSTGLPDHVVMFLGMQSNGAPTSSTVSSCSPSKVMVGALEEVVSCSTSRTASGATITTQSTQWFTPMVIQAPEEGSDVEIVPFWTSGFMGGGPAA